MYVLKSGFVPTPDDCMRNAYMISGFTFEKCLEDNGMDSSQVDSLGVYVEFLAYQVAGMRSWLAVGLKSFSGSEG